MIRRCLSIGSLAIQHNYLGSELRKCYNSCTHRVHYGWSECCWHPFVILPYCQVNSLSLAITHSLTHTTHTHTTHTQHAQHTHTHNTHTTHTRARACDHKRGICVLKHHKNFLQSIPATSMASRSNKPWMKDLYVWSHHLGEIIHVTTHISTNRYFLCINSPYSAQDPKRVRQAGEKAAAQAKKLETH